MIEERMIDATEIAAARANAAGRRVVDVLEERLALPPFLEPRRARIEAGLKPL